MTVPQKIRQRGGNHVERHLLSGLTPEEETQLHDLLQKVYDTMDS